jgi:hypothetical protein
MWIRSEGKPEVTLIRAGTIDDAEVLRELKPQKELYCGLRPGAFAEYPGIAHEVEM